jgi:hypothetical protein
MVHVLKQSTKRTRLQQHNDRFVFYLRTPSRSSRGQPRSLRLLIARMHRKLSRPIGSQAVICIQQWTARSTYACLLLRPQHSLANIPALPHLPDFPFCSTLSKTVVATRTVTFSYEQPILDFGVQLLFLKSTPMPEGELAGQGGAACFKLCTPTPLTTTYTPPVGCADNWTPVSSDTFQSVSLTRNTTAAACMPTQWVSDCPSCNDGMSNISPGVCPEDAPAASTGIVADVTTHYCCPL